MKQVKNLMCPDRCMKLMKSLELILYDMGEQTKLELILNTMCSDLMTSQPGSEKMMLVY